MTSIINEDELFLKNYNPKDYERISVAVDLLVFTIEDDKLKLLVIKREEQPYKNYLALPGVFVGKSENLDEAVKRGIKEETGLENIYFEQLYTWGNIDRDPRMRVISVSYIALVSVEKLDIKAGQRVTEAKLYEVDDLLSDNIQNSLSIAFDHRDIIKYAVNRLENKVSYSKIAFEFVPQEFTLPQLQKVYEILLKKPLYKANFRKKIYGMVEETNKFTTDVAHRPSRYYKLKK